MTPTVKRWLHYTGTLLAVTGIFYTLFRMYQCRGNIDLSNLPDLYWFSITGLSIAYGSANVLLSIAWWIYLKKCGGNISFAKSLQLYGVSQIAKYLPGNIFHLAGRQALGMAADIPGKILATSTLFELVSIAVAGSVYLLLASPLILPSVSRMVAALLFLTCCGFIFCVIQRLFSHKTGIAFLFHIVFLGFSGLIFAIIVFLSEQSENKDFLFYLQYVPAYIVAWLAGFVTPGAPAGIGIREAILLHLNTDQVSSNVLLLGIIVSRMVTMSGDFLFYIFAIILLRKP